MFNKTYALHNFRRLDGASQNEEFILTNVNKNNRSARSSMFRKSKESTHPISVIEFCVFLRLIYYRHNSSNILHVTCSMTHIIYGPYYIILWAIYKFGYLGHFYSHFSFAQPWHMF